jgi:hypothetical protein
VSTFTQQLKTFRGRGARSNASGRFEAQAREDFDDGWTLEDPEPEQIETTVSPEKAKVIISRNDSPDVGFSASINPYRGCEHEVRSRGEQVPTPGTPLAVGGSSLVREVNFCS